MNTLRPYQELAAILAANVLTMSPAELHGMLSAFVCAGSQLDGNACVGAILTTLDAEDEVDNPSREALQDLYAYSAQQLSEFSLEFALLIPDDYEALPLRAEALSQWCQGFMAGLGMAGFQDEDCSDEVSDVIQRFYDIAQLDYEQIEVNDADEKAFAELYEYVRMAVHMIYNDTVLAKQSSESDDRKLH